MAEKIKDFARLLSRTRELSRTKGRAKAVLIGADEPSYLKMMLRAEENGLIDPILVGPREMIDEYARLNKLNLEKTAIIVTDSRADSIVRAVKLVNDGGADFLVRGNVTTGFLLARLFERPTGLRIGKQHISHVAIFEHILYPRLLIMSDGAVTVAPDINKKLAIIQNAVKIANILGIDMPKVAMLAAVEVIYTAMPVTMEGAIISKMADRGQIKNCLIDGPLSTDVAVIPDVARQKGITSEVAGQADIIIAPNIETGNGIYKAMSIFARAKTAGIIIGSKVPIAISSRCDTTENLFNSLVLAAFVALNNK